MTDSADRSSGTYDDDDLASKITAVGYALTAYGPTPAVNRSLCHCPACLARRAEQALPKAIPQPDAGSGTPKPDLSGI